MKLTKPLILGEETEEGVKNNKGAKLSIDSCILCDKKVWISEFGYTKDNPISDISVTTLGKEVKALHKMCLLELVKLGFNAMKAMEANLKARGKI